MAFLSASGGGIATNGGWEGLNVTTTGGDCAANSLH